MELAIKVENGKKNEEAGSFYEWNANSDDKIKNERDEDDGDNDNDAKRKSLRISREFKETLKDKIRRCRNYQRCISVRVIFMAAIFCHSYHMYCIHDNRLFFLLCCSFLVIIIDGAYVFYKRKGRDHYW
jgi:hypothetical protein